MDLLEIAGLVLGGGGLGGLVTYVFNYRTNKRIATAGAVYKEHEAAHEAADVRQTNMETDRVAVETMEHVLERMERFSEKMECNANELQEKLAVSEQRRLKAYSCDFIRTPKDCVVLTDIDREIDCTDCRAMQECEVNI